MYVYTCIRVYVYTCTRVYLYTCIRVYVYMCIYIYIYTYIYIYIYIHLFIYLAARNLHTEVPGCCTCFVFVRFLLGRAATGRSLRFFRPRHTTKSCRGWTWVPQRSWSYCVAPHMMGGRRSRLPPEVWQQGPHCDRHQMHVRLCFWRGYEHHLGLS